MGKGLNQRSAARWLQRAADAREIEEVRPRAPALLTSISGEAGESRTALADIGRFGQVLSAYVFCKMRSGTTPTGSELKISGRPADARGMLTFCSPAACRKLHLLQCYLFAM